MGIKIAEGTSIISIEEMEIYRCYLEILITLVSNETVDKMERLDDCLQYLTNKKLNSRDIQNLLTVSEGRNHINLPWYIDYHDNQKENIRIAICAALNIYHQMQLFKTAIS